MEKLWDEDVDGRQLNSIIEIERFIAEKAVMALNKWVDQYGVDNLMSEAVSEKCWESAPLAYTSIINFFELYHRDHRDMIGKKTWRIWDFLADIENGRSRQDVRHWSSGPFKEADDRLRGIPIPREVAAEKRAKEVKQRARRRTASAKRALARAHKLESEGEVTEAKKLIRSLKSEGFIQKDNKGEWVAI